MSGTVPVRGRLVLEGIRFAAGVASGPSGVVTLWKAATGGKTVGCVPFSPVPEILHAAGLLPIALESREDIALFSGQVNGWLVEEDLPPSFPLPASDPALRVPSRTAAASRRGAGAGRGLAEWVDAVSGSPASEGGLWKSIRAYGIRRSLLYALDERIAREPAFLTPEERRVIDRAGIFLPPEAHSRLLSAILGVDPEPAAIPPEEEKGDPLIVLAKRLMRF